MHTLSSVLRPQTLFVYTAMLFAALGLFPLTACTSLPAPYLVTLILTISFLAAVLFKPGWGIELTIILVPVSTFSTYLAMERDWNFVVGSNYIDLVPLCAPVILISFLAIWLWKIAGIGTGFEKNPLRLPFIVLFLYAGATVAWSDSQPHSLFQFLLLAMNLMLFSILTTYIHSKERHQRVIWVWLISVGIQGIIAIMTLFGDTILYAHEFSNGIIFGSNIYGGLFQDSGWPNPASGLQVQNETAFIMNMGFATTAGLLMTAPSRGKRAFLYGLLFLILFVIMKTDSRGGIISLLVTGAVLFAITRRLHKRFFTLMSYLCLTLATIYLGQHLLIITAAERNIPPRLVEIPISIITGKAAVSVKIKKDFKQHSRSKLYRESLQKYAKQPLTGFGVGNLKRLLEAPHAHSIYFSLWFDFGIIGLLFIAVAGFRLIKHVFRVFTLPPSDLKLMSLSFIAGLAGMFLHCLVDFEYNTSSFWLYIGLAFATFNLAIKDAGKTHPPDKSINL